MHPRELLRIGSAARTAATSPFIIVTTAVFSATAMLPLSAQESPAGSPFQIYQRRTNALFLMEWQGNPTKSYFVQYSKDLVTWEYSPNIYRGKDSLMSDRSDPEGSPSYFVRLVEISDNGQDPAFIDSDGDGVANIVELQQGSDPFNPESRSKGFSVSPIQRVNASVKSSDLPDGPITNQQVISTSQAGDVVASLGPSAVGHVSSGVFTWSSGSSGQYRGLLSPASEATPGRGVIVTLQAPSESSISSAIGFTGNGALNGLFTSNGMGFTIQKNPSNSLNRLITNVGSPTQMVELTSFIKANTPYRMMLRKEADGFSSWIQGGIFDSMGGKVGSPVWFPVAKYPGVNPVLPVKGGVYNAWPSPVENSEFTDVSNLTMDSASSLLDYERNKNGLHVPSLIKLPGGCVLAAWQNSTLHESTDCVIKVARRDRSGAWGPVSTVVAAGSDGASNNGPVLHKVGNELWLTYQSVTSGLFTVRKRVLTVSGDTITLSDPVTMFDEGLLLNHILSLPGGRLVACWHTHSSSWKNRISYSDDNGQTWTAAVMPEFPWKAAEGFAIIEADGTLASYWRTDRAAIYRATSSDGGATWSTLAATSIPCANMPSQGLSGSRVCGFKRPSDGKIVIVGNNSTTQREKLTAWLVENGNIVGTQSILPIDVADGSAEGVHYPDVLVHPDNSMTVIFARWLGGGLGSAELHSAINTFRVPAAFE